MGLPDFIIIGAMRSGTSWLANLLQSHPEVFLPKQEVHFFDKHFDKGCSWYEQHFPPDSSEKYRLTGEKSPAYLSHNDVPGRVANTMSRAKIIGILRNPVDRAVSHYKNHCQYTGYDQPMKTFIESHPSVISGGFYARHIKRWYAHFPVGQCQFVIFEEVTDNPPALLDTISSFLNIDPAGFDRRQSTKVVNASYVPVLHPLYVIGSKVNRYFWRKGYHRISRFIVSVGQIFKLLPTHNSPHPPIQDSTIKHLSDVYRDDMSALESLLDRNIKNIWDCES